MSKKPQNVMEQPPAPPVVTDERTQEIIKALDIGKPSGKLVLESVLSALFSRNRAVIGPQAKAYIIEQVARNCGEVEFRWFANEVVSREPMSRPIVFMVAKKFRLSIEGANDNSASRPQD